jgi:protein TonB
MYATLHTFPPLQAMNSPRSWILAAIVLLHLGFFALLSSGMGGPIIRAIQTTTVLISPPKPLDQETPQPPPPKPQPINRVDDVFVPEPPELPPMPMEQQESSALRADLASEPSLGAAAGERMADPIEFAPQVDPRLGLSEPYYPASEIRAGHTGTVLLSIYVLENGRVGDVRVLQSSGHPKLDESALREARKWRLRPGVRDGVPVAMWKEIPITFQLQGPGSRRF